MFQPFELERFFAQHEFTCKLPLCCSDPESLTIHDIFSLTSTPNIFWDRLQHLHLGYTESPGHPELRQKIASSIYSLGESGQGVPEKGEVGFNFENILIHTGAQEVIFSSSMALLKPTDTVIIMTPCYQSHYEVPRAMGCKMIEWPLEFVSEKWQLDFNDLENKLKEFEVKMLLINSPHNPTGFHFTLKQQAQLIELVKKYNVLLIADEVNRHSEHKEGLLLPSFAQLYKNCISIGVLSKSFGLPGLRLGWAASQDLKLLDELAKVKDYTTITNPAPSEIVGLAALDAKPKILERLQDIYLKNLEIVESFVSRCSDLFTWQSPSAGIVGSMRLNMDKVPESFFQLEEEDLSKVPSGASKLEIFCYKLLKSKGVLLAPLSYFDAAKSGRYNDWFRVGYGRLNFEQGIQLFEEFLKENHLI